jgi:hypothetical protein
VSVRGQENHYTQTVRGVVTDVVSEMPIVGATVIMTSSTPQTGASSDANGEFRMEKIPLGRCTVQISAIGYETVTLDNLDVVSGKETVLNIKMTENVITTEEVVIKGTHTKSEAGNEMALVSARSFSVEETEKYAGSLGDPSRMAANFAGVMSVSDQRNDIIIRGNSPVGLLWRIDGIDVPNPNHFGALGTTGGPVSMLNNNLLANSDFYTGAFPAEYGNAMSGVFDLNLRNGNNQKREYVGQVGFNGFELGTEGPFSKKSRASYLINFRYSTMEVMNKMGLNVGTGNAIPQYKDLSFKVNIPMNKGRISLFGIGGKSYIQFINSDTTATASYGTGGTNTYFGSDMGVVGLSYYHYFNDKTRSETHFSAQGAQSNAKLDSLNKINGTYPFFRSRFAETKYSFSEIVKHKFDRKNNGSIGITADLIGVNYTDSVKRQKDDPIIPGHDFLILTDNKNSFILIQAFAELQHRFTDALTLYSGVHWQQSDLNGSFSVEPRLSMKWNLLGNQSVNFGAGMHSQLQPHYIYFLKTQLSDGTYIETNRNLGFSRSNQLVLGYQILPTKNFRIKAETYYQYLYDIPISPIKQWYSAVNEGAGFGINGVDSLQNKGNGTNYGLELTMEKFFKDNYYFLITGSLFESKYKGYDNIERNTVFNGNFVVNGLAGYEFKIGKNNSLGVDMKGVVAGGMRQVPVLIDQSIAAGKEIDDYAHLYDKRYDNYMKFDLRISFKQNGKRISQEYAFDLQNFTNNKNIFQQYYNPTTEKMQTEYQNGIFPMFLYRIRF